MTTSIYPLLIFFSKISLRERVVFGLLFHKMDLVLLVLRLVFFFPPPNCLRTVFANK